MGRINCKRCTRWRPLLDFGVVVYNPTPYISKEYIRKTCEHCHDKDKKLRYKRRSPLDVATKRELDRDYQNKKRRIEGRPERPARRLSFSTH
jgi:hypothetical protein